MTLIFLCRQPDTIAQNFMISSQLSLGVTLVYLICRFIWVWIDSVIIFYYRNTHMPWSVWLKVQQPPSNIKHCWIAFTPILSKSVNFWWSVFMRYPSLRKTSRCAWFSWIIQVQYLPKHRAYLMFIQIAKDYFWDRMKIHPWCSMYLGISLFL